MNDLVLFRCVPLSGQLTRSACGKRHAEGRDPTCATCVVGRAHEKGAAPESWPNGQPLREILYRPGLGDITRMRTRRRLALAPA